MGLHAQNHRCSSIKQQRGSSGRPATSTCHHMKVTPSFQLGQSQGCADVSQYSCRPSATLQRSQTLPHAFLSSGLALDLLGDAEGSLVSADGTRFSAQLTQKQRSQERAFRQQSKQVRRLLVSTAAVKSSSVGPGLSASSRSSGGSGASSAGGVLVAEGTLMAAPGRLARSHMQHHRALVLDSGYRPINVVPWPRAVQLDVTARADVLDYYPAPACAISGRGEHPLPAVVRVYTAVNLHGLVTRLSCTRRNILIRDKFTCQYCGAHRDLTLDHVVPASRGGRDTWLNLVTACGPCNQKKADNLLSNMPGWKLRTEPREPKPWELGVVVGLSSSDMEHPPPAWEPYIEHYRARQRKIRSDFRAAGMAHMISDDEDSLN